MRAYLKRVLIAFSIFINVLLGGKVNQTVSATQWQRKRDRKWNLVWLIDAIFYKDIEHCMEAWVKWQIIHQAINSRTEVFKSPINSTKNNG
jgi:hypothetical protein